MTFRGSWQCNMKCGDKARVVNELNQRTGLLYQRRRLRSDGRLGRSSYGAHPELFKSRLPSTTIVLFSKIKWVRLSAVSMERVLALKIHYRDLVRPITQSILWLALSGSVQGTDEQLPSLLSVFIVSSPWFWVDGGFQPHRFTVGTDIQCYIPN